jgi:hypothetical protein
LDVIVLLFVLFLDSLLLHKSHDLLELVFGCIEFSVQNKPLGKGPKNCLDMLQVGIGLALAAEQAGGSFFQAAQAY